jgi:hypothetical protein
VAQLAHEEPPQQVGLGLGGSAQQPGELGAPAGVRPGAGPHEAGQPLEGGVDLADGERRVVRRLGPEVALGVGHGGPTNPDAPLAGAAGQPGDGGHDLVVVESSEQVGEGGQLGRARPGGAHQRRRRRHRREQAHR